MQERAGRPVETGPFHPRPHVERVEQRHYAGRQGLADMRARHRLPFHDHDGVSQLTQPTRHRRSGRTCTDHADGRFEAFVHTAK